MADVVPHFRETVSGDQYNYIMAGQAIFYIINATITQVFTVNISSFSYFHFE